MCGIFGAISTQSVTPSLLEGLNALSYRGYDSSGLVVGGETGLQLRRSEGKIDNLVKLLGNSPLDGGIGIAHTRWATHGDCSTRNAHPHMTADVAVVHNGIIENYQSLRAEMSAEGMTFESDTDSEVIPVMVSFYLAQGMAPQQALYQSLSRLEGSYAIAAIFSSQPDRLYAARKDSSLIIAQGQAGIMLASDVVALGNSAELICPLTDGQLAVIASEGVRLYQTTAQNTQIQIDNIPWQPAPKLDVADGKQGFEHFMLKEIYEQGDVIERILNHYLDINGRQLNTGLQPGQSAAIEALNIVACGTSYYAACTARYWLESIAGIPTDTDLASEFRYRNRPMSSHTSNLFISQSGETADTLAALRYAKAIGCPCLSMNNVPTSTMALESDTILPTLAGPEIGVASTKAFMAQLTVLLLLSIDCARHNGSMDFDQELSLIKALHELPSLFHRQLLTQEPIIRLAQMMATSDHALFIGRGQAWPLAQEGALKLKEISYIHAEAYAAGELKHGPIALVDEQMPVVVIAPPDELQPKTLSNLREVASRGGKIILIADSQAIEASSEFITAAIPMPQVDPVLFPLLYTLPLQLLAYHVAKEKGLDIDKPRNLAKSVTVE
ncbi:glutamine--fructose-6-phosphate transaminase (isomerizing) [Shewanella submarina]|uniref:Glutamine--fructose-6-phosphate aminotransferase [isomerizing] n=1 Tax=Shewanella submarina TaxID=2016376 RepID=A0ABV7GE43_9GAMM|nr:glutamine--fructose-6-phosphate transaminase (isomerizing) [Shewanella submarina]MCL1038197.1 glutamine--fructose-6-phosphate transaminase (isomerizing) [Shewanella submarina]